jgi:hypothetical protein
MTKTEICAHFTLFFFLFFIFCFCNTKNGRAFYTDIKRDALYLFLCTRNENNEKFPRSCVMEISVDEGVYGDALAKALLEGCVSII